MRRIFSRSKALSRFKQKHLLQARSKQIEDRGKREPFWKELVKIFLPLIFGSLVIGIMVEGYKHEVSSRKELINEYFRPMRETQSDCQTTHNNLFLKQAEVAGTFLFMGDEVNRGATNFSKMPLENRIILESILSTHTKTTVLVKELEQKLNACIVTLFRQYEELALVTGKHSEFIGFASIRAKKIGELYKAKQSIAEPLAKNYGTKEKVFGLLAEIIASSGDENEMNALFKKHGDMFKLLVRYQLDLSENEHEMFKIDVRLFEDLHGVFASEISDRFKRGWFARTLGLI